MALTLDQLAELSAALQPTDLFVVRSGNTDVKATFQKILDGVFEDSRSVASKTLATADTARITQNVNAIADIRQIPVGGTVGQFIQKGAGATEYEWEDVPSGTEGLFFRTSQDYKLYLTRKNGTGSFTDIAEIDLSLLTAIPPTTAEFWYGALSSDDPGHLAARARDFQNELVKASDVRSGKDVVVKQIADFSTSPGNQGFFFVVRKQDTVVITDNSNNTPITVTPIEETKGGIVYEIYELPTSSAFVESEYTVNVTTHVRSGGGTTPTTTPDGDFWFNHGIAPPSTINSYTHFDVNQRHATRIPNFTPADGSNIYILTRVGVVVTSIKNLAGTEQVTAFNANKTTVTIQGIQYNRIQVTGVLPIETQLTVITGAG